MSKKKATSSDVAKRAGVSQATVSMVLNKKYNVSFSPSGGEVSAHDGYNRAAWHYLLL